MLFVIASKPSLLDLVSFWSLAAHWHLQEREDRNGDRGEQISKNRQVGSFYKGDENKSLDSWLFQSYGLFVLVLYKQAKVGYR